MERFIHIMTGYIDIVKKYKKKLLFIFVVLIAISFLCVHAIDKFDRTSKSLESDSVYALSSNEVLSQEITGFEDETLSAINIQFATYSRTNTGKINIKLYKDGELYDEWHVLSALIGDNIYHSFELQSPVSLNGTHEYEFSISESYEGDNCVGIWMNSDTSDGKIINGTGQQLTGSICYTLTYRNTSLKCIFLVFFVLIAVFLVIMLLMNFKEEFIMGILLAVLMIAFMWSIPLGQVPDEPAHFWRAYEVAEVSLVSKHFEDSGRGGDYLPAAVENYSDENAIIDTNDVTEVYFTNVTLYSPVSYIPQALGIKIAGFFTDNVSKIFYAGRFGSAIVNYILCMLALWIIPFGKKVVFLFMTFPITLQEMISMAPDGFTIAMALFFMAYVLRVSYVSEKVSKRDVAILAISGIILSLLKIVYLVLLVLVFLIPNSKFKDRKKGISFKVGILSLACLFNFLWLRIASGFLMQFNPGVDSTNQVKFILSHIPSYYVIAIRTLLNNGDTWLSTMIGSEMGWLNIHTLGFAWILLLVLLVYEIGTCCDISKKIHKWDCLILLFVFLSGCALIFTSLYVQWTPFGYSIILGIQGRYFIPILATLAFFVIFTLHKRRMTAGINVCIKEPGSYYYLIIALSNGFVLLDVIKYYIEKLW